MTSRKPLTANDFAGTNGREILVKATIRDRYPEEDDALIVEIAGASSATRFSVRYSNVAQILPEVFKVGDTVWHSTGLAGEVKAVDEGKLAVAFSSGTRHAWWFASHCTRVEKAK